MACGIGSALDMHGRRGGQGGGGSPLLTVQKPLPPSWERLYVLMHPLTCRRRRPKIRKLVQKPVKIANVEHFASFPPYPPPGEIFFFPSLRGQNPLPPWPMAAHSPLHGRRPHAHVWRWSNGFQKAKVPGSIPGIIRSDTPILYHQETCPYRKVGG